MKLFKLTILILLLVSTKGFSQQIQYNKNLSDTSSISKKINAGERNVFLDPESPHFIFVSANQNFIFGMGGVINMTALYDFNGLVNNVDFVTADIPVPTNTLSQDRRYGFGLGQSKLYFKLVGDDERLGRIIAYIDGDFRGIDNAFRMRQAYVSVGDFLIGQTWSTFMDLDAAIPTIDGEGPNTQISTRQPMIRYSHKFGSVSGAIALEMPSLPTFDSISPNAVSTYSRIPDIPLRIKYEFPFGHVQTAGVLRSLSYKNISTSDIHSVFGWGLSLSGSFDLPTNTSIVYQGIYGKGITNYIQDLSSLNFDLIPIPSNPDKLEAVPMYGGYVGIQQYLNKKETLYSDWVVGYAHLGSDELKSSVNYKYTFYSALNILWDFIPSATVGIEYLAGLKVLENNDRGTAHRIDMLFKYSF